ncbi:hypothetical protein ACFYSC_05440 [Streptosporangium sp. NPDC004379]|uniref:hypothetical protein n=1 Tax=Streptosporangium sp. NPDC004379 TaxID=3366189 RepID=UPI0036B96F50
MTVHDPLRHLHRQGRPGHGRLRSVPAPDVAALLTELERSEPRHAGRARDAIDRLTGGEPLEALTELTVCEFLWYTLPTQVAGDREAVASALGRLLALGGLDRYAALCSSPVTARVLRAYERSEEAGTAACRRALDATGLLPPDLPELRWSSIMGPEERGAHGACSAALELALVCGEPAGDSAAGREALTRRWLTEPRADLGGDSWLHRVRGERLNRWVLGRGDAWRELAQPFEAHLHAPVPAPAGTFLPALRWLLELGRRPGGMVPPAQGPGPSRPAPGGSRWSEGELEAARELAEGRMGALRRVGRRLVTTREGRRLLGDRDLLWEAASAALLAPAPGEDAFRASAREAALMLLAEGAPADRERVAEVVGRGEGRAREVDAVLADLARRLAAFGLRTGGRLTPAGRSAVLAALRSHALRPRSYAGAS